MNYTVLIIDDSLTVRTIMKTSIQRAGFAAYAFPDGLQALQALTARQVPLPDAILLDVGLPKLDGYAVARALKRQPALQEAVIIMLSGHDGRLDKLRGRLAGAQAYVTKPFQPAQVMTVLRAQLSAREPSQEASGKAAAEAGRPAGGMRVLGSSQGGRSAQEEERAARKRAWGETRGFGGASTFPSALPDRFSGSGGSRPEQPRCGGTANRGAARPPGALAAADRAGQRGRGGLHAYRLLPATGADETPAHGAASRHSSEQHPRRVEGGFPDGTEQGRQGAQPHRRELKEQTKENRKESGRR